MSSEPAWLTISEAARWLGITPQAIRKRLKRGTINCRRGNHGHVMVEIANPEETVRQLKQPGGTQPIANPSTPPPFALAAAPSALTAPPSALAVPPSALAVPWSDHLRLMAELQTRHDAELVRWLDDRDRSHREAIEFWRERSDAAEMRAEQANAMLADLVNRIMATIPAPASPMALSTAEPAAAATLAGTQPEPWWLRLFGRSRRSKLGR
jgi:hypothetical protein